MKKDDLLVNIKHGLSHIHDEVFDDIDIDEIMSDEDPYVNKALDKYTEYLNYSENPDKYNLKYCFKTTIKDLNEFYAYQERKLDKMRSCEKLCDIEHKVNTHIYDEVILCQKKVNRYSFINAFTAYFLAFTLIFVVTEITHLMHFDTLIGTTFVALVMALVKVFIDKRYLEIIRVKVGWKSYRKAVVRSLAFYFASVIVLNHCEHHDLSKLDDETMHELKSQVRNIIDILLSEIVFN